MLKLSRKTGEAIFAFLLFVASCSPIRTTTTSPSPPPTDTPDDRWGSLPIFPGAIEIQDQLGDGRHYHYITHADLPTVRHYYEDEMPAAGWNLLESADVTTAETGKAWSLFFTKDHRIAQIDIFISEDTTHVVLQFDRPF